jgi:type II secretory pathway pseudopilin PulG
VTRTRLGGESGTSLVELGITLLITSIMSASLISWITAAGNAAGLHSADDVAVQELRLAKEHISRDLRVARAVLVADAATVSVWVDADEDEYRDPGEAITWTIADGNLTRRTDLEAGQTEASGLDMIHSAFTYDATTPAEVRDVMVTLVSYVDAASTEPGTRTMTVEIHVRNAQ